MSSREFAEWMAYDRIEPIGPWRADVLAALLATVVANAAGGKAAGTSGDARRPFTVADFLPQWPWGEDRQDGQDEEDDAQAWAHGSPGSSPTGSLARDLAGPAGRATAVTSNGEAAETSGLAGRSRTLTPLEQERLLAFARALVQASGGRDLRAERGRDQGEPDDRGEPGGDEGATRAPEGERDQDRSPSATRATTSAAQHGSSQALEAPGNRATGAG